MFGFQLFHVRPDTRIRTGIIYQNQAVFFKIRVAQDTFHAPSQIFISIVDRDDDVDSLHVPHALSPIAFLSVQFLEKSDRPWASVENTARYTLL